MAKEAGRFEAGLQPHGMANGRIQIWLLDSRDCPSMCFHGPSISLSTGVILLVYDQCLQTLGRLQLLLASLKICECLYFSAFTQDQKGKNIGQKKQASSNTSISKGKCSYCLKQEWMTSHTLVTKEVSSGSESGNSLI